MYKQVILVRQDLQLPKGKLAAQVAHGAVEAYSRADVESQKKWKFEGQMKIVLKVKDESELFAYLQLAKDAKLPNAIITDAGKTVISPGTVTVLAIGPALENVVDALTGNLALL